MVVYERQPGLARDASQPRLIFASNTYFFRTCTVLLLSLVK